jgi:hypothetical protein
VRIANKANLAGAAKAMQHYKQLLLKALDDDGWELESRDDDTEWWADEHWLIRSTRQNWGLELTLSFLVDPQYEGHEKEKAVWAIAANSGTPLGRLAAEKAVALMPMTRGKFDERLRAFVHSLNRHRSEAPDA